MTVEYSTVQVRDRMKLIDQMRLSVSRRDWDVGNIAWKWESCGGSIDELCEQTGLEKRSVTDRLTVWKLFQSIYLDYPNLYWSHFFVAMYWDNPVCALRWADDAIATPAEMKAWKRAMDG